MATLRSVLILAIKGGDAGLAVEFHRTTGRRGLRRVRRRDLNMVIVMNEQQLNSSQLRISRVVEVVAVVLQW